MNTRQSCPETFPLFGHAEAVSSAQSPWNRRGDGGVGECMRLFAAFFLPEHINDHLQMALDSVSDIDPASFSRSGRPLLRWVAPHDRHLTLGFFGEVPSGAVDGLTAELSALTSGTAALPLRLRGAGVFTGRTLWAGVQEQQHAQHSASSTALTDLMRSVQQAGNGHSLSCGGSIGPGQPRERRRAHVTLARVRDRRRGEEQIRYRSEALAVYEGPAWTADVLHLVASELGAGKSGAPKYSTLAELPLVRRN